MYCIHVLGAKWYGLDHLPYGGYDLHVLIDLLLVDHSYRVGSWVC
jgi:hypothetical protein